MNSITEKTSIKIKIAAVGSVLAVFGSGVWWAANVNTKVSMIPEMQTDIGTIKSDVAYMKGALQIRESLTKK